MWRVVFTNQAQKDARKLAQSALKEKAEALLEERKRRKESAPVQEKTEQRKEEIQKVDAVVSVETEAAVQVVIEIVAEVETKTTLKPEFISGFYNSNIRKLQLL